MTPRQQALAFRIWQYCDPREWNVTHKDVADALGVSVAMVSRICRMQKDDWSHRLRATSSNGHDTIHGYAYRLEQLAAHETDTARYIAAQFRERTEA